MHGAVKEHRPMACVRRIANVAINANESSIHRSWVGSVEIDGWLPKNGIGMEWVGIRIIATHLVFDFMRSPFFGITTVITIENSFIYSI